MNNGRMLDALLALPDAEMRTETKIDDPIGAGSYYSARTVVRLLAAERERCARECDNIEAHHVDDAYENEFGRGFDCALRECAAAIRFLS
jgi:hypothetical protein